VTVPQSAPRVGIYAIYLVAVLLLVNVLNYGQRMLLAVLLPVIKADLSLSDTELGLLMGGLFGLCYALAAVPLARVADRLGRSLWLAGSLAVWSGITAGMGFAQSFTHLVAGRIGIGLAEAPAIPCSHSLIADHVPAERQALAFSVHSLGGVIGISAALALGGHLAATIGWRETFVWLGLPGVLVALLVLTTVREGERPATSATAGWRGMAEAMRLLLSEPFYLLLLGAICVSVVVEFGLNQWLPTFYVRQFGLTMEDVGYRYGLAVAAGGIPGGLFGGLLCDRLMRRDRRWVVWMPAVMYAIAIPIGIAMLLAPSADIALLLNGAYGFLIYSTSGCFWAACLLLAPPDLRATASATALMVSSLTGLTLGPIIVGMLSDVLMAEHGRGSLRLALVAIESIAVLVIAALVMAGRNLERREPAGASQSLPITDPT
jgi:predicted MFS family arabinose efflux permease